jgi:RNA polymerase sigma factor (TIGR02999 family)
MADVTKIIELIQSGRATTDQLFTVVYGELRRLAKQKLAAERVGHSLQATALVHEAFLRLCGNAADNTPHWDTRGHFFAAASEAMRRILIDSARRRNCDKRGGNAGREALEPGLITAPLPDEDLIAVHEVVDKLSEIDPVAAQLVKLRFFAGLNMSEVADVLGISVRSAQDVWSYARAWLRTALGRDKA